MHAGRGRLAIVAVIVAVAAALSMGTAAVADGTSAPAAEPPRTHCC